MIYLVEDDDNIRKLVSYALTKEGYDVKGFAVPSEFWNKTKTEIPDLVMLDIKEINPQRHKELTGFDNSNILDMARYLSDIQKPMWIRHVLVPETTDFDEDLDKLGAFIKTLSKVERTEILPYHTLGRFKWDELGIKYRLDGISPPTKKRIENAKHRLGIID